MKSGFWIVSAAYWRGPARRRVAMDKNKKPVAALQCGAGSDKHNNDLKHGTPPRVCQKAILRCAGCGTDEGVEDRAAGYLIQADIPEVRIRYTLCISCLLKTWGNSFDVLPIYIRVAEKAIAIARRFIVWSPK